MRLLLLPLLLLQLIPRLLLLPPFLLLLLRLRLLLQNLNRKKNQEMKDSLTLYY